MDELIIEDKKYVSSKRAAKITGYAKDYIGQLCREGRVPARLVGRSWYVLETAIQDHRFGTTDIQPEERAETPQDAVISQKWESPKYESAQEELLPSVNRLRDDEIGVSEEDSEELKESERLQDTWKTWFDRIADADTAPIASEVSLEKIEEETEEPINVPVHAVYRQPPEELLPRSQNIEIEEQKKEEPMVWSRASVMAIQIFSVLLAIIVTSLAIAGSGYLDEYIISNSQVRIIAGIGLYNK